MIDPVDAGAARAHVDRLLATGGVTRTAIAAAAGITRKTLGRVHRPGRRITALTEAKILAVTLEDCVTVHDSLDPALLARLLDGDHAPLPYGGKAVYHTALREHGWSVQRIGDATRASYDHVKLNLLRAENTRLRTDLVIWQDACRAACQRDRGWQEYCQRMETQLQRVLEIGDRAPPPIRAALRAVVVSGLHLHPEKKR